MLSDVTLAPEYANADPRFQRAIRREMRQDDALRRAQAVILSHPDLDPVERLHLIRTLASLDRRGR